VALNKVRLPGILTLLMGMLNVGLAVSFVKLGWGALGIAAAGAIVLTMKNAFFTPIYAATIQELPWWTFLKTVGTGLLAALFVIGVAYAGAQLAYLDSWMTIITLGAFVTLLYIMAVHFFVLHDEDNQLLMTLLPLERIFSR